LEHIFAALLIAEESHRNKDRKKEDHRKTKAYVVTGLAGEDRTSTEGLDGSSVL